uniref:Uncharacterized protein n=1 Tax=Amphimedon queenslandica TaxID=400682 RepID=A0A1X7UYP8_AMPQE
DNDNDHYTQINLFIHFILLVISTCVLY